MKARITLTLIAGLLALATFAQSRSLPTPIEVAFLKTVHISFPSKIKYVDLGSDLIIADKADEVQNVLRIKAAYKGFSAQTNFSVICEDGSFWSFQATYNESIPQEYYEMKSMRAVLAQERATNNQEVQLSDINGESPLLLDLITKSLHQKNERFIKNVGQRKQRIESAIKGVYIHNDILYFHLSMKNKSNISYDIDYMRFNICDQKKLRKQANQELPLTPVREFNGNKLAKVPTGKEYHTILAFNKFTIAPDKKLSIYIAEKNGGRHLSFDLLPSDIIYAKSIKSIEL